MKASRSFISFVLIAALASSAVVALLALAPAAVRAQAAPTSVIIVGVSDAETGEALAGTQVVLPALSRSAQTDGLGEARFLSVPSGLQRIRIRRLGYAAIDTSLNFIGDTSGVVFRLMRVPVTVEGVEVKVAAPARLRDFEMRRAIGTGRYLTAADLEREGSRPFGIVAMTKFPGLQYVTDGDGRPHISSVRGSCGVGTSPSEAILTKARSGGSGSRGMSAGGSNPGGVEGAGSGGGSDGGRGPTSSNPNVALGSCAPSKQCYVLTFLDNLQLDSADFDLITTWDIAGVEYYTGNSVPPRYRVSGAACGVLLIWSK